MAEFTGCHYQILEDGGYAFYDVRLPSVTFSRIYLAPGGVCAVTEAPTDPKGAYESLRSVLGVSGIVLYLDSEGCYDPFERAVTPIPGGYEQQEQEIAQLLQSEDQIHSPERLLRLRDKLTEADAYNRGYYRNSEGTLFLLRHDRFEQASETDPERLFAMTLFGGIFGLHRYAMGKIMSGLFFTLTCGGFLVGWLLDLLTLFLGVQRDRRKLLIPPLENRRSKLLRVAPAIVVGIVALSVYSSFFTSLGSELSNQTGFAESIAETLLKAFPQLSELAEN